MPLVEGPPAVARRRSVSEATKLLLRDRALRARWLKEEREILTKIEVYHLFEDGATLDDIAAWFGVSSTRTIQAWKNEGKREYEARERCRCADLERPPV